jgi:cyclophilin family peptidyl-prolyl cis-trans isomerase
MDSLRLFFAFLFTIPATGAEVSDGLFAIWHTERGEITAELFFEEVPLTVACFVGLAEGTIPFENQPPAKPFYDGLTFHRVAPGFVVQGGDPAGNGSGGPGFSFPDEFRTKLKHDTVGTLAMANAGPNTNGSQFYFTLSPVNRLNYKHTVFGRVVQGAGVLSLIEPDDVINRIEIVRVGANANAFHPDAAMIAELRAKTPVVPEIDPVAPPFFSNETDREVTEWFPPWIAQKLNNYRFVTGITVRVRLISKFDSLPAGASTANPVRYHHDAVAAGNARAATLFFVAGEDRWRLWLGDELLGRFGLDAESVVKDPGHAQLNQIKSDILAEAREQLAEGELRRSIDMAVTGLIERLDGAAH